MPELTYQKRKRMRSSSFALEKERKYPIHDIAHARNALARVAQHGTRAEQKEVKREVYAKYPSLRPTNPKVTDIMMGEVILYGGLPMTRANVYRQALKDTGSRKAADMFAFGTHIKLAPKGTEPLSLAQFRKATKLPSTRRVRITPKRPRIS